ncbi:PREDICTED: peroxisome assembly factor 2 [Dinoponera quadriceps]|uniref:Peroxisomal ATPase PEX6 n=1 Tax=Dinoponera quadriceps TaxID=609295 RepID=A0A6P3YEM1_DINQU|nr:PREDICTED: peroxisome assembly factor 2 [Dinoponera quadriceps]XP_014488359.1 PREDICTED: peroxisome assembly factor 2 [Dinoponera quadriceps]
MDQKMLLTLLFYKNVVRGITSTLLWKHPYYVLSYIFLEFLYLRLQKLFKQNFCWVTLPDIVIRRMLDNLENTGDEYIDYECCALANVQSLKKSQSSWFAICSMISMRKYKCTIISIDHVGENTILISETMRHNLLNNLCHERLDESCFILPSGDDVIQFATEAKIFSITTSCDCSSQMVDVMLANYFLHPRYLHVNDVIRIDAQEYAQDRFYTSGTSANPVIYLAVKSLRLSRNRRHYNVDSCYVVRGISTLVQEAEVHSYIPRKHVHLLSGKACSWQQDETEKLSNIGYPSVLMATIEYLESCIAPFLKDSQLHVKPMFLLKGPRGCGKHELVELTSERMGLNFLDVDFAEVQALSSAPTEAKLRIVLQTAQRRVPCLLYLNNIQVFGKTAEGQKDERIISTFSKEIATLYETPRKFPLIIVAASDEADLPAELQRLFIETIHVRQASQSERAELISWFLSTRNLTCVADLATVAGSCSDFRFADLLALSLHAAKLRGATSPLTQEDFERAYEYMQSVYCDGKGAVRVPTVHWHDIGGLAQLKHEIIRRIQMPLLNAFGFGQSGLLLYGPPGTGKTLLAKAVATEYRMHFLSVKGPEVLNMYVGQSERNVREIFKRARASAPCIIFFDELDSLAPNRGRSGDSGGVMDRVVSQLLAEMDGLEESSSIFIMGATNRPDLIDPALLRPGRFDKMLYVGIHSDRESKLSVLRAQTRRFKMREHGRELELIVDQLPDNLTGADLYSVSSNTWLNAVRETLIKHEKISRLEESKLEDNVIVESHHFLDAIRNLVPSVSDTEIRRYKRMQTELSSS